MRFVHSNLDYGREISDSAHVFDGPFQTQSTEDPNFLLPFNPAVTDSHGAPSVAFFGFNAYCAERCYPAAKKEPNFAVWCQERYNTKLFNVMEMWKSGLCSEYQGPFYFTNFIKLVLRESLFMGERHVKKQLSLHCDCVRLFEKLAIGEIEQLKAGGCKIFICFGSAVYDGMCPVAEKTGVKLIHDYHFSRYRRKNTERLISEVGCECRAE